MNLEELRKQFFTDTDVLKTRLEPLVEKVRHHCEIDKTGQVAITNSGLSNRDKLVVVLIARAIAGELDPSISSDVTVAELAKFTRVPTNQLRARGQDAIKAKLAESTKPGVYRAAPHRIETFLNGIDGTSNNDEAKGRKNE
jgi:hypothetical protein